MGECQFCERVMETSESCTKNAILYPEPDRDDGGQWFFAIPYGQETRGIIEPESLDETSSCPDCGIRVGGYHHPGCDIEESPITRSQLLAEAIEASDAEEPYHARGQGMFERRVEVSVDPTSN